MLVFISLYVYRHMR